MLKNLFDRIKWQTRRLGIFVQNVVVTILLSVLYILGFGITKLVILIFDRKQFRFFKKNKNADTYWSDSKIDTSNKKEVFLKQV